MRVLAAALSTLPLLLGAVQARADTAASLQILQDCLDATAPTSATAGAIPIAAPAAPDMRADIDVKGTSRRARAPDLRTRCPQLSGALADLGLSGQLSSWNGRLDRGAVEDLLRAARRYAAAMPTAPPQLSLLPAALARLRLPLTARRSWWQALKQRLRQWLDQPQDARSDWLQQLLSRISIPLLLQRLILYGTTAAVLIMAAWVIVRELRAAGQLAKPSGARAGGLRHAPSAQAAARPLTLEDVEQAAPRERSIVLLRLLVQALLRSGRLSLERACTYRELAARSAFDDAGQRERFTRLAQMAERDRYGEQSGAPAKPQPAAVAASPGASLQSEGRLLYEQLLEPLPEPRTSDRS